MSIASLAGAVSRFASNNPLLTGVGATAAATGIGYGAFSIPEALDEAGHRGLAVPAGIGSVLGANVLGSGLAVGANAVARTTPGAVLALGAPIAGVLGGLALATSD